MCIIFKFVLWTNSVIFRANVVLPAPGAPPISMRIFLDVVFNVLKTFSKTYFSDTVYILILHQNIAYIWVN